jgi:hypothetical protein
MNRSPAVAFGGSLISRNDCLFVRHSACIEVFAARVDYLRPTSSGVNECLGNLGTTKKHRLLKRFAS